MQPGTDAEPGAGERGVHELHREADGVWAITLPGNLHGTYYLYRVYFPDGRMQEVVDPYARSAGANGQRGMVLDLTRAAPEGWDADARPAIPPHARACGRCMWRTSPPMRAAVCAPNGAGNSWALLSPTPRWTVTARIRPA